MLVLAKDAAEAVTPVDVQPGELIRVGDWSGSGFSGRTFAMP
jgi:hypothetical protein